jgi:hypothetical protein
VGTASESESDSTGLQLTVGPNEPANGGFRTITEALAEIKGAKPKSATIQLVEYNGANVSGADASIMIESSYPPIRFTDKGTESRITGTMSIAKGAYVKLDAWLEPPSGSGKYAVDILAGGKLDLEGHGVISVNAVADYSRAVRVRGEFNILKGGEVKNSGKPPRPVLIDVESTGVFTCTEGTVDEDGVSIAPGKGYNSTTGKVENIPAKQAQTISPRTDEANSGAPNYLLVTGAITVKALLDSNGYRVYERYRNDLLLTIADPFPEVNKDPWDTSGKYSTRLNLTLTEDANMAAAGVTVKGKWVVAQGTGTHSDVWAIGVAGVDASRVIGGEIASNAPNPIKVALTVVKMPTTGIPENYPGYDAVTFDVRVYEDNTPRKGNDVDKITGLVAEGRITSPIALTNGSVSIGTVTIKPCTQLKLTMSGVTANDGYVFARGTGTHDNLWAVGSIRYDASGFGVKGAKILTGSPFSVTLKVFDMSVSGSPTFVKSNPDAGVSFDVMVYHSDQKLNPWHAETFVASDPVNYPVKHGSTTSATLTFGAINARTVTVGP